MSPFRGTSTQDFVLPTSTGATFSMVMRVELGGCNSLRHGEYRLKNSLVENGINGSKN
jgi:hypothetical protein